MCPLLDLVMITSWGAIFGRVDSSNRVHLECCVNLCNLAYCVFEMLLFLVIGSSLYSVISFWLWYFVFSFDLNINYFTPIHISMARIDSVPALTHTKTHQLFQPDIISCLKSVSFLCLQIIYILIVHYIYEFIFTSLLRGSRYRYTYYKVIFANWLAVTKHTFLKWQWIFLL